MCYFCQDFSGRTEAQGQCRIDGRFVCRPHSAIRDGVLICLECALGGQEGILQSELDDLRRISDATCGGCGKLLIVYKVMGPSNSIGDRAGYLALTKDRRERLQAKFAQGFAAECRKRCITCLPCQRRIEPSFFSSSNRQCLSCGEKYIETSRDY